VSVGTGTPRTFVVCVPIAIRRRGGRKLVVRVGTTETPVPDTDTRPDRKLLLALARAWRWRRQIEAGLYQNMTEIATAENVTLPYVARLFRLLLLAPAIVEALVWTDRLQVLTLDDVETRQPLWRHQVAEVERLRLRTAVLE
jgi:hypothetical protein